jgi:hypothetical protein
VAVHRVGDGEFHLPLSLAERRRRACKIPRDIYTIICKASWATCWSDLSPQRSDAYHLTIARELDALDDGNG